MKKLLIIHILIITLLNTAINNKAIAQNDADPAITSFSFAQSPIDVGEETTLTTFITNGGFTTSAPAGSVGILITLPTGGEYAASPESIAALSGSYVGYFDWTYDIVNKRISGTSNQDILPGEGGMVIINIKGYSIANSISSNAEIIILTPALYPNDNPTNNNLTSTLEVEAGVVLPIKLISFNATKQNNIALLNWETSQETNSGNFEVQMSKDGTTWQTIGIVQAVGNSSNNNSYSFTHNAPVKGINYYRLKHVDLAGKLEISAIRSLIFNTNINITVAPNPTTDIVYVSSGNNVTIKTILVYSADGKLLAKNNNFALSNSVDLSKYAPGVYLFKIIDQENKSEIIKVIKK